MKAVTEFASITLSQALKLKQALAADGKTPEEIQQGLGEKYKFEGEKLTYFVNAIEVASQNADGLKRVLVVTLADGENAPDKATQIDQMHYLVEGHVKPKPKVEAKPAGRDGNRPQNKGRGKTDQPKTSPWGLSPEEKAAKLSKSIAAQQAAQAKAK
jgi:hypothetical protein